MLAIINEPKQPYYSPPSNKVAHIIEIIKEYVISAGKAESIVLYGSIVVCIKEKKALPPTVNVLVVTRDRLSAKAFSNEIKSHIKFLNINLNIIAHPISIVNSKLEDVCYLFSDIKKQGIEIYNSGRYTLNDSMKINAHKRVYYAIRDYRVWFNRAKLFFQLSITSKQKNHWGLTAFNLHQCSEMCYTCIEMVYKHHRTREHQLSILRKKIKKLDARVALAFPTTSKKEKDFFAYLDLAYASGRYLNVEEFPIIEEQLEYWFKETAQLISLTQIICREHISILKTIRN